MNVLFAPHQDDEVLFSSWTILRHRPRVVIVLHDEDEERRMMETALAFAALEHQSWEQWQFPDYDPDWLAVRHEMIRVGDFYHPEVVYAPAVEEGGHLHHNAVGQLARDVFGPRRVEPYLTYTRTGGRSRGREVPYEPGWVARKLRALACYESQIERDSTRAWFTDLLDVREYVP